MNSSEVIVAHWLTRQRCNWVYIDQSPNLPADGALRIAGKPSIHRPDLLALMDGLGAIAIDIKCYAFRSREARALYADPQDGSDWEAAEDAGLLGINYVKLVWTEVEGLLRFQRASNIPTWLCIINDEDREGMNAFFYRVDHIADSFSWLFSPGPKSITREQTRYFPDWPQIQLSADAAIPSANAAFEFVIEEEEFASCLRMLDWRCYVPPFVVDLRHGTSLHQLATVVPAVKEEPGDRPSGKMLSYANAIAQELYLELPNVQTKSAISHFIGKHKQRFDEVRNRRRASR